MRQTLKLHPDSLCPTATRIEVEAARSGSGNLMLRYVVTGSMSDLRLPPAAAPARGDELWRRSCFEAFLRASPGGAYYELNFAPSLQWAAYRFSSYRSGMSVAEEIGPPQLEARSRSQQYELEAALALDGATDLPHDAVWQLGLSAVIEDTAGRLSYWALAHPSGKPDFHHSDCFALELPVAVRP